MSFNDSTVCLVGVAIGPPCPDAGTSGQLRYHALPIAPSSGAGQRSSNSPDFLKTCLHVLQPYRLGPWSRFSFEINSIAASREVQPSTWQAVSASRKHSTIVLCGQHTEPSGLIPFTNISSNDFDCRNEDISARVSSKLAAQSFKRSTCPSICS